MTMDKQIWDRTIELVRQNPSVNAATRTQLSVAIPRGMGGGALYLEVPLEFTKTIIETVLRDPILQAFQEIPEAQDLSHVLVLVNPALNTQSGSVSAGSNQAQATQPQPPPPADPHPAAPAAPTTPASAQAQQPAATYWSGAQNAAGQSGDLPQTQLKPGDEGSLESSNNGHNAQTTDFSDPLSGSELPGSTAAQTTQSQQRGVTESPISELKPAGVTVSATRDNHQAISTRPVNPSKPLLNPNYTFETFVPGDSNRFARAAAMAVTESPGDSYNPLFIYGSSGLGKTHLMHAIGHQALDLNPDLRVKYVATEELVNDFINSIHSTGTESNIEASNDFQERYRNLDILMVDDVQFLDGRTETIEAVFHIFNHLHTHNKQVVFTSDVHPSKLSGIPERLITRFEWGLTTDIQAPNLETRIVILQKKAERENMYIQDDAVFEFIARHFTSSVRELEGRLTRITAWAEINNKAIDIDLVTTVLKDEIPLELVQSIHPKDIIKITADRFKISVDDMCGKSRAQQITLPRQISMYLCRDLTDLSLPKIGQLYGGRDHTTVMHAINKITELVKSDRQIYEQVSELTELIKKEH